MERKFAVRVVSAAGAVLDSISLNDVGAWTERLSHDDRHLALGGWGLWIVDLARHVTEAPLVSASDSDATRYIGACVVDRATRWSLSPMRTTARRRRRSKRSTCGQALNRRCSCRQQRIAPPARRIGHRTGDTSRSRSTRAAVCRTRSRGCATFGRASRASCSNRGTALATSCSRRTCAGSFMRRPSRKKVALYLRPFPGPGSPVRLSNGNGTRPRWRADGRGILFLTPDHVSEGGGARGERQGCECKERRAEGHRHIRG